MSEDRTSCPACGVVAAPDARFCEACGTALGTAPPAPTEVPAPSEVVASAVPSASASAVPPAPACRECGGVVDEDGYCTSCGAKAPNPRDHAVEGVHGWVGAVTDRGARRSRNEDAFAVAADELGTFAVLVVCDGVSSAEASDVASLAAAHAARDSLASSRAAGAESASRAARLVSAAEAAHRAVVTATPREHGDSPPSCTLALALLEDGTITAGGVGDSRAYWLPDAGPAALLTADDSLAAELIAAGASRAEAEAGPFAHTITRWLGVDSPGHVPHVTGRRAEGAGWLLACSDGLWNYCSDGEDLGALVRGRAGAVGGEPLGTASALVEWAIEQGGHDNITVTLARVGHPAAGAHESSREEGRQHA